MMNTKTITKTQASELALALIGIEPSLKLYDSKDYDQSIVIDQITPTASGGQLGIEVDFTFGVKPKSRTNWIAQSDVTKYRMMIDYWDAIHFRNPAILGLFHYVNATAALEVETLANITVVTDLLRKWKIW